VSKLLAEVPKFENPAKKINSKVRTGLQDLPLWHKIKTKVHRKPHEEYLEARVGFELHSLARLAFEVAA
jgi:hypothetical protein